MSESNAKTVKRKTKDNENDITKPKKNDMAISNGKHDQSTAPPLKQTNERAFQQLQNHPFNRKCVHSLLSSQSDIQNYRGIMNVAAIILVK